MSTFPQGVYILTADVFAFSVVAFPWAFCYTGSKDPQYKEGLQLHKDYKELYTRVLNRLEGCHGTGAANDHMTMDTWEWPQGVAIYAMYKLYKSTNDPAVLSDITAWYDKHLAKGLPGKNVNTVAPMLTMVLLYQENGNETYRKLIEEWADWVMTAMPRTEEHGLQHITYLENNTQQLWDDTLYMTCLFLYQAGIALNRNDLKDEAAYQFLLHIKYLHSPKTGLWYHGFCFIGRHHFGEAYWGRGNSWFTAGAVDFIEWLPEGPVKELILTTWKEQCKALAAVQDASGLWHTLLDQPDSYLETSASAAFAYGFLKGVRLGLLDESYKAVGEKALEAVLDQVAEDGTVQGVSYGTPIGATQDFYRTIPIEPTAYGQGLTFLMLTEKL